MLNSEPHRKKQAGTKNSSKEFGFVFALQRLKTEARRLHPSPKATVFAGLLSKGRGGTMQKKEKTGKAKEKKPRAAHAKALKKIKAHAHKEKHNKGAAAQPEINIGMIGHVDHGKTSLTKALTGKWCDTHSEEMKRGISIRLGYADTTFYKLKTNNGIIYSNDKSKGTVMSERLVSFVDAPGHETLMTTMLSGAVLMNGAVLVIAANEICPQPRTVEHLMALKFAGVEKIVVAQNKVDLVDAEKAKQQQGEIKKFLKEYGYENAPIIPTVANFGTNIDYLIEAIETHIPTPKYELHKGLKMFIARSFDINRPGTKVKEMKGAVVGGSITQGKIKLGDEVQLYPGIKGKTITKVISLATDSGMLNEAVPGGLIAVGTEIDPSIGQNDRLRGQIIGKPGSMPEPTKVVLLKLNPFERAVAIDQKAEIRSNDIIVLTIGTNTAIGTAAQSAGGKVIVSLKNEVVAEKGEKVAVSKNLNNQWRLVAYGEVL